MKTSSKLLIIILTLFLLLNLYNSNFLIFHSIIELFSIIVAFNIFIIGWNCRKFTNNKILLLFGIAYFAVGIIDALHMLTFKEVGIFPDISVNIPTQFWIIARFFESISFLFVAIISIKKKDIKIKFILSIYLVATVISVLCILRLNIFPVCYLEESGLTIFKVYSEYIIGFIFIVAGMIFWKYRERINLNKKAFYYLLISLGMTVVSEICFTLYEEVVSYPQYWGHIFKLMSFYLIYEALIEESLKKPYSNLFKEYNNTQKQLIVTGSIMSTMLHDIKNPLTNIRAISQIRREKDKEYYAKIMQHVDNITEMIIKINKGFDSINIQEINPVISLNEAIKEVQTLCHLKNIELQTDIKKVHSKVLMENDLFKRVIYNLVNNAANVLDEDGIIKINIEELKNEILISISDNGPGIPQEIQDDIFQPFITGDTGTGLGLYMVDFAVSQVFSGKVWFESKEKKGTIFYISLPKVKSESINVNWQEKLKFNI